MRTEEYISMLSDVADPDDEEKFGQFRKSLPLGVDADGKIVRASAFEGMTILKNLCVTGARREEFICRTLIALSCLYDREEAHFLVVSPNTIYAEMLRLNNIDATVPYIRTLEDLDLVKQCIYDIFVARRTGGGYPRLFVVLDGLEELPGANRNKNLSEYSEIFNMLMQRSDTEVICGVDLMRSIFSGCPGGFIGIGNCLVTALETGKSDVTYVANDASLTQPRTIVYPSEPSVTESIRLLNTLGKNGNV